MFALREINCYLLLLAEVLVSFSTSSKAIFELLLQYLVEMVNSSGDWLFFGPSCFKNPVLYWMKFEVKHEVSNQTYWFWSTTAMTFSQYFQPKTEETMESSSECTDWSVYNMKRIAQPQREIAFNLCTVKFSSTCLLLAAHVPKQLPVIEWPWLGTQVLSALEFVIDWCACQGPGNLMCCRG